MLNQTKVVLTLCFLCSLMGCSTIEGIGKDLKKGGQAIQDAANR